MQLPPARNRMLSPLQDCPLPFKSFFFLHAMALPLASCDFFSHISCLNAHRAVDHTGEGLASVQRWETAKEKPRTMKRREGDTYDLISVSMCFCKCWIVISSSAGGGPWAIGVAADGVSFFFPNKNMVSVLLVSRWVVQSWCPTAGENSNNHCVRDSLHWCCRILRDQTCQP